MKIIAIAIFLLPGVLFGQSKKDYQAAMFKFQKFYNAGQGDSINALINKHMPEVMRSAKPIWTNESASESLKKYGTLKSFQFIGIDQADPEKVHVFETIFSKAGPKTTSLTLFKNGDIGTFRFITYLDDTNQLVKKLRPNR